MLISDVVRLNARRQPVGLALKFGDRTVTFEDLYVATRQVANAMRELAEPGDRIAILAENVPEYIECYYGVPAAGMALTFLNYRLHPEEWAWILRDAEASVLIVQAKFLAAIEPLLASCPALHHLLVIDDGSPSGTHPRYTDVVGRADRAEPDVRPDEDSTAWLLYTSGTTGFPKGAMLTHRNLTVAMIESVIEYDRRADDVQLVAFPLCHVSGYSVPVTHLRGGTVVLTPTFEPRAWLELVERHRVTTTTMAPTMLNMILQHPELDAFDVSSLRSIGYGAAAMPVEILRAALAKFGPVVFSGFGMTELGGNVLSLTTSDHERAASGDSHLLASCGRPMCLAEVRIVDEEMNDCPSGVVGEIVVRGEQVTAGYYGNPTATTAALRGGWFHTGDLAKRDDEGFIYIVDRAKDMIITGGENVYSREVEEALYAHPAVSEAAVIGLPDPTWGENVAAVVVLREGQTATEAEVIEAVKRRLASFKKPKSVIFVDELPKTVSGKILKRELRDQLAPDPPTDREPSDL